MCGFRSVWCRLRTLKSISAFLFCLCLDFEFLVIRNMSILETKNR
jgi:hypothetical protein